MIRASSIAAQLLAVSCAEPQSVQEMLDVIAVRTGDAPMLHSAYYALGCLCKFDLLRLVRPGVNGHQPALYVLTPAGEIELDRLFMTNRLFMTRRT